MLLCEVKYRVASLRSSVFPSSDLFMRHAFETSYPDSLYSPAVDIFKSPLVFFSTLLLLSGNNRMKNAPLACTRAGEVDLNPVPEICDFYQHSVAEVQVV